MNQQNILELILDPRVAIVVFLTFCIVYLVLLDTEGYLASGFLSFGPSPTYPAKFAGLSLDTWNKVLAVYGISFATSLVAGYYEISYVSNFMEKLIDPELRVPFGFSTTISLVSVDKIARAILTIINIFVIMTQQLQFILPGLIANIIVAWIDATYLLGQKKLIR